MLEAKIEKAVCDYAKERGFLVYKFTSPNRRSVPDRLLIHPDGTTSFIEFKRTGEKATPAQEREHIRLRGHNKAVFVVDDIEQGKKVIDQLCWEAQMREWDKT